MYKFSLMARLVVSKWVRYITWCAQQRKTLRMCARRLGVVCARKYTYVRNSWCRHGFAQARMANETQHNINHNIHLYLFL